MFETLKDVNYRFRDYIDLFNNKEVEHRLKRNYKLIMNQKENGQAEIFVRIQTLL